MNIELQRCDFLTAYIIIDNEDILLEEVEKFRRMVVRAREKGLFTATKFEYKLLNKALKMGPEQLVQTIRHITPEKDRRAILRITEQAHKFLPFVVPDQVLSDWAVKQINRYFVRGKLRGECEQKLQTMVEALTDSFVVNALIESTRSEEDWQRLVEHIKQNFAHVGAYKEMTGKD
uniref:hypothetical protein n=1 Tax=Desulforadius tongensis TaxID=1216062 RepID=UPI0019590009|nr:hypothetical protein [Desulforadius tongensis]